MEAGRTLSYVETVDGSRADSLHRRIGGLYEDDLRRNFELLVRKVLKKARVKRGTLAFDTTKEFYWGRNGGLNVRGMKHERGADEAWEWLVVSLVQPFPIPLMALPYRQGDDLATLTIELLRYVQSLNIEIDVALFDRGFYIGHLIDFLESERIKYLMLVPENERMKNYGLQTETIASFTHLMKYAKEKSSWKPKTKIVVIKDVKKGKATFDVFFATNLSTSMNLLAIYPKRWQIETNFRVMDEAKIKSKSNKHIIRYFYFLVQLLLHVAWNATKKILQVKITFKKYLAEIAKQIFKKAVT